MELDAEHCSRCAHEKLLYLNIWGENIMAIIRFGHEYFDINENNVILDNGTHYVIITKEIGSGLNSPHPMISKMDFNDLRIHGMIFANPELMRTAHENEKSNTVTYWKFKMELINEYYG